MSTDYTTIRQYGTKRQQEIVDALTKHGSIRKAAAALGIAHQNVEAALQRMRKAAAAAGAPAVRTREPADLAEGMAREVRQQVQASESLRQTIIRRDAVILDLQRELKSATLQLDEQAHLVDIVDTLKGAPRPSVPILPKEKGGRHEGAFVLLYSDLHPEETVEPGTVSGRNEFTPQIAVERNADLAIGARWMLDLYRERAGHGYKIRQVILAMLGDLITNTIHEELLESNALSPPEAVLLVERMAMTIIDNLLADPLIEDLYIPTAHGNHDRITHKKRAKTQAVNSYSWLVYHHLASRYAHEPRVRFDIAKGSTLYTDIYGHRVRWTHGDDFKYGGGVGGLTIPLLRALPRWDSVVPAHLTCMGHWHQAMTHRSFVVNGSLIGYTAYAQQIGASFEPAQQVCFLLDARRGKRLWTTVQVQSTEGWS